ncbi:Rha family transcriptional regulator [Paenibacillus riograndensis]|uniref:Rha family transcriptional regulator n=1 Tax=Paenibacillus riograndensis TaxID=483937 RepID=UPI000764C404|nr:phage regulatory protein/antirepressor Ant [Paenibacillus riograndensis]
MTKLVFIQNNRPLTDSITVAETFGKEHRRVMQDIRELDCSKEFNEHHFVLTSYKDTMNREKPKYLIDKDGFAFLVMGYTGKEAAAFKEAYIKEFNRMHEHLAQPMKLPSYSESLRLLAAEIEKNQAIEAENERLALQTVEQDKKLKEQATPVAIYNLAISAHNTMSMQEVAKALGTGRTRLYQILREEGVIMKNSTMPYQRYLDGGFFKVTERPRASGDTIMNDPATRVYAKGFDLVAKIIHKRLENKPA